MPKSTPTTDEIDPIENPRGWFKKQLQKFFLEDAIGKNADLARVTDIIRNKKSANGLYAHYRNEAIQHMEGNLLRRYDWHTDGEELHPSFTDLAQIRILVEEVFDAVLEEKRAVLKEKETELNQTKGRRR